MSAPCSAGPELWMSDLLKDQRRAAQKCRVLCPFDQLNECRDEGWHHEFGVWGGLTPADRKKEDPERYEAGLSKWRELSDDLDRVATKIAEANAEPKLRALPESQREEAPPKRTRSWSGVVATCAVEECERNAVSRGWCVKHYHRWRNTGSPLGKRGVA